MISVPDEVHDKDDEASQISLKLGINENCDKFNLHDFWAEFCSQMGFSTKDFIIKRIQTGSAILEAKIDDKFGFEKVKLKLKMFCETLTDKCRIELGKMKLFFMYMGPIKWLNGIQKFRSEIKLNLKYNRIYVLGHDFWTGSLNDGRDRGNQPYYCPVGWKRWSFYVAKDFYKKFKGWCICYHGTKFECGLAILLGGLKPAKTDAHGAGIYATPSINYACHPRYAEVKAIESSSTSKFFPRGKYAQFVLECRVHPDNIERIRKETLGASGTLIDSNISDEVIEWVVNHQNKDVVNFNDPNASVICTGIMVRITDDHPGLLPESKWWFSSHLCSRESCCLLGISLETLKQRVKSGYLCNIVYD